MSSPADTIQAAGDHLRRHPADRFPVEHATGQFHLGVALADAGRAEEARAALDVAARLFLSEGRTVEEAKVRNALGAVFRLLGRPADAADAFAGAADAFAQGGLAAEEGAAAFNLGLVRREQGDLAGAREAFTRARELLEGAAPRAQLAAAVRELGATELLLERADEAAEALTAAVELSRQVRDRAGVGAASNVLGLAHLAAGRPAEAVDAFMTAAGHHHRRLHGENHAMALANLALAHEAAGDAVRARVAARHAIGVPAAPEPVREQAAAVLERLPPAPGDVVALLRDERRDRWPAVVRAEVEWWIDAGAEQRRAAAAGWIGAQAADEQIGEELAHALLGGALELSPELTERVIAALVEGVTVVDAETAARFRAQVARALPRFHAPQWTRLEELLDRAATAAGQRPWSTS